MINAVYRGRGYDRVAGAVFLRRFDILADYPVGEERADRVVSDDYSILVGLAVLLDIGYGVLEGAVSGRAARNDGYPRLGAEHKDLIYLIVDEEFLYGVDDNGLRTQLEILLRGIRIAHAAADAACEYRCDYHSDRPSLFLFDHFVVLSAYLLGAAARNEPAVVEDYCLVADVEHLLHAVGDKEHRDALVKHRAYLGLALLPEFCVADREHFVENEYLLCSAPRRG